MRSAARRTRARLAAGLASNGAVVAALPAVSGTSVAEEPSAAVGGPSPGPDAGPRVPVETLRPAVAAPAAGEGGPVSVRDGAPERCRKACRDGPGERRSPDESDEVVRQTQGGRGRGDRQGQRESCEHEGALAPGGAARPGIAGEAFGITCHGGGLRCGARGTPAAGSLAPSPPPAPSARFRLGSASGRRSAANPQSPRRPAAASPPAALTRAPSLHPRAKPAPSSRRVPPPA